MRYLLRLVGPDVPWAIAEAGTLAGATIEETLAVGPGMPGLAVARLRDPAAMERAAYTSAVLDDLGSAEPGRLPFDPDVVVTGTYAVRVHGTQDPELQRALISRVWRGLSSARDVDLEHPDVDLHAFVARPSSSGAEPDRVVWGRLRLDLPAARFTARPPRRRPFWSSLATDPRLARFMVNLSAARPGESMLDPCCGTGSILVEGALVGLDVFGGDVSERSVAGCRLNLADAGRDAVVRQLDARDAERWGRPFDAVVSDLPYGRSASVHGVPLAELYDDILRGVRRVLPAGRQAVLMTAAGALPAAPGFEMVAAFDRVVHDELTRRISVLERR
jgi:putative methyltransferase (TIGR01177 family)